MKELTITPELLKRLYITSVTPKRDPTTGFVVGGKNSTELVLGLKEINGLTIADIEKDLRPPPRKFNGLSSKEIKEYSFGFRSRSGFLSATEKLLEVMAEDNRDVVESLGLTHQALARPLLVLPALAVKQSWDGTEVSYRGSRFFSVVAYDGFQLSPFRDGTQTNSNVTVENLGNGKSISCSLLVPQMIDRYGFYEGKGREYRVEPRQVLAVFPFLFEHVVLGRPGEQRPPERRGRDPSGEPAASPVAPSAVVAVLGLSRARRTLAAPDRGGMLCGKEEIMSEKEYLDRFPFKPR